MAMVSGASGQKEAGKAETEEVKTEEVKTEISEDELDQLTRELLDDHILDVSDKVYESALTAIALSAVGDGDFGPTVVKQLLIAMDLEWIWNDALQIHEMGTNKDTQTDPDE